MPSINRIDFPIGAAATQGVLRPKSAAAFENVLKDAVQKVENFQAQASRSVEQFLSGESEDLHRTVMDTQRAELSFELFSQARNKVIQAYQEIMRTQL